MKIGMRRLPIYTANTTHPGNIYLVTLWLICVIFGPLTPQAEHITSRENFDDNIAKVWHPSCTAVCSFKGSFSVSVTKLDPHR